MAILQRGGHFKVINNQKQQSYRKQTSRGKKATGTEKLSKEGKVEVMVITLTSYRKTKTTISKWGSVCAPEHLPGTSWWSSGLAACPGPLCLLTHQSLACWLQKPRPAPAPPPPALPRPTSPSGTSPLGPSQAGRPSAG